MRHGSGIGVASSYPAWPPLLQSNLNIFDGRNVKEKNCQKSFHFACRALNSVEKNKKKRTSVLKVVCAPLRNKKKCLKSKIQIKIRGSKPLWVPLL